MSLGKRLQDLRKINNITQPQLAKIIGVNDRTIGMWERDLTYPSSETLAKIADYFKVSTDYLLCRDTENIHNPLSEDLSFLTIQRKYESSPPLEKQRMLAMIDVMFSTAFNEDETEVTNDK